LLKGDFAQWHTVAEYWTGLSILNYKLSLWKNTTPHDLDPVQFYKHYIKAFKSYFDNPLLFQMQDLNLKIICWKLIENDTSMPNEFLRQKDIDFQASLSNIHNKINRPYARRLSWQI